MTPLRIAHNRTFLEERLKAKPFIAESDNTLDPFKVDMILNTKVSSAPLEDGRRIWLFSSRSTRGAFVKLFKLDYNTKSLETLP